MSVFSPADILLPALPDLSRWACIACDQFTADPAYWDEAARLAGEGPSALRLILPEAWLGRADGAAATAAIYREMESYVNQNLFRTLPDSFVYVERELPSGGLRRGLVGKLDLEAYDWAPGARTPVRATEGTVEDRLPARVAVRRGAALEMPHIMLFMDDAGDRVLPLAAGGAPLYDFALMLGGGRIRGWRVSGAQAARVQAALDALAGDPAFAVGDGNHSLAAAKRCWEAVKPGLDPAARAAHPLRYALAELVNLRDAAQRLEPIHRVLLGTAPAGFLEAAARFFPAGEGGEAVTLLAAGREARLAVPGGLAALVARADALLAEWAAAHGGAPDYIHGEAEARRLAAAPDAAGVLLPRLEKGALFPAVAQNGPFPKKSFSIGAARDKRYYLECRLLRP